MSIPTIKSVQKELQAWKKNTNQQIATYAADVLDKLRLLTREHEVEANVLANELERIIIQPVGQSRYPTEFIDTLYKTIQLIGFICPRNKIENGQCIDPINLEAIKPTDLFVACDRYQFSKKSLIRWHSKAFGESNISYRNPVTSQVFNAFDQRILTAARAREQNSARERVSRFMSSTRFFLNRPEQPETRSSRLENIAQILASPSQTLMVASGPNMLFFSYNQMQNRAQHHNSSTARYRS